MQILSDLQTTKAGRDSSLFPLQKRTEAVLRAEAANSFSVVFKASDMIVDLPINDVEPSKAEGAVLKPENGELSQNTNRIQVTDATSQPHDQEGAQPPSKGPEIELQEMVGKMDQDGHSRANTDSESPSKGQFVQESERFDPTHLHRIEQGSDPHKKRRVHLSDAQIPAQAVKPAFEASHHDPLAASKQIGMTFEQGQALTNSTRSVSPALEAIAQPNLSIPPTQREHGLQLRAEPVQKVTNEQAGATQLVQRANAPTHVNALSTEAPRNLKENGKPFPPSHASLERAYHDSSLTAPSAQHDVIPNDRIDVTGANEAVEKVISSVNMKKNYTLYSGIAQAHDANTNRFTPRSPIERAGVIDGQTYKPSVEPNIPAIPVTAIKPSSVIAVETMLSRSSQPTKEIPTSESNPLAELNPRHDPVSAPHSSTHATPQALDPKGPIETNAARINNALVSLRDNGGQIDVSLTPEELGRLSLKLDNSGGVPLLSVSADRAETQELIRRHFEQLQDQLVEMGLGDLKFSFNERPDQADPEQTEVAKERGEARVIVQSDAPSSDLKFAAAGLDIRM